MVETITHFWQASLTWIGAANPVWIFLAISFLPLFGVPAGPLLILTGTRGAPGIGFSIGMAGLLVDLSLGYWLGRGWLRPAVASFSQRRGWRIPQCGEEHEYLLILFLRVTPGIPLFAQNYLLGLARVGFARYLLVSVPIQAAYLITFLWLGRSLAERRLGWTLFSVGAFLSLGIFICLMRRWLEHRGLIRDEVRRVG